MTQTHSASHPLTANSPDRRPLIAHVIFRLDYGGLENGVVNVVNGLPENAFRHCIIAMTEASDFRLRIRRPDVGVHALDKQPGKDPGAYWRLFRLLRQLRPSVVHTRNLGTLEGAFLGRLAGVGARIHGEHGWDVYDPDGTNTKYRRLRRLMNPSITRFVTVSKELEEWLVGRVGIDARKVQRICNGVDTDRFSLRNGDRSPLPESCRDAAAVVIGSVTRFSEIKDPLNLVRAFIEARRSSDGHVLRLVMLGDGALRAGALTLLEQSGNASAAWLPGSRDDVAELMRSMDVFVLGSRREGISNTVLEAMASGLPCVASGTGGNLELIRDQVTGRLVPPGDSSAIASVLLDYARSPRLRLDHGTRARERAEQEYSLRRMLNDYEQLYRGVTPALREAA
jgi:sugar transferase (PEP-CTERM/EpsH1 system associated)